MSLKLNKDYRSSKCSVKFTTNKRIGLFAIFHHPIYGLKTYLVKGWFLDPNGCLKTHGDNYDESFLDDTQYTKHRTN